MPAAARSRRTSPPGPSGPKYAARLVATVGPTPYTSSKASPSTLSRNAAARSSQPSPGGTRSTSHKDTSIAVCSPTCGMPSPLRIARQRSTARALDRPVEVLGALAAESIESLEVLDGQAVEVAAPLDHAALQQLLQHLPAGPLDVHPAATDEMRQLLGDPRRALRIRAVHADRALVLHDFRAAHRTGLRHHEFAFRPGPLLDERAHDLGDHITRLLQDHVSRRCGCPCAGSRRGCGASPGRRSNRPLWSA